MVAHLRANTRHSDRREALEQIYTTLNTCDPEAFDPSSAYDLPAQLLSYPVADASTRLLQALCICHLLRVTAPVAPYEPTDFTRIFNVVAAVLSDFNNCPAALLATDATDSMQELLGLLVDTEFISCIVDVYSTDLVGSLATACYQMCLAHHQDRCSFLAECLLAQMFADLSQLPFHVAELIITGLKGPNTDLCARLIGVNPVLFDSLVEPVLRSLCETKNVKSAVTVAQRMWDKLPSCLVSSFGYLAQLLRSQAYLKRKMAVEIVGYCYGNWDAWNISDTHPELANLFLDRYRDSYCPTRLQWVKLFGVWAIKSDVWPNRLRNALDDPDASVRCEALLILATFDPRRFDSGSLESMLKPRMRDLAGPVRRQALTTAGKLFSKSSAWALPISDSCMEWFPSQLLNLFYVNDPQVTGDLWEALLVWIAGTVPLCWDASLVPEPWVPEVLRLLSASKFPDRPHRALCRVFQLQINLSEATQAFLKSDRVDGIGLSGWIAQKLADSAIASSLQNISENDREFLKTAVSVTTMLEDALNSIVNIRDSKLKKLALRASYLFLSVTNVQRIAQVAAAKASGPYQDIALSLLETIVARAPQLIHSATSLISIEPRSTLLDPNLLPLMSLCAQAGAILPVGPQIWSQLLELESSSPGCRPQTVARLLASGPPEIRRKAIDSVFSRCFQYPTSLDLAKLRVFYKLCPDSVEANNQALALQDKFFELILKTTNKDLISLALDILVDRVRTRSSVDRRYMLPTLSFLNRILESKLHTAVNIREECAHHVVLLAQAQSGRGFKCRDLIPLAGCITTSLVSQILRGLTEQKLSPKFAALLYLAPIQVPLDQLVTVTNLPHIDIAVVLTQLIYILSELEATPTSVIHVACLFIRTTATEANISRILSACERVKHYRHERDKAAPVNLGPTPESVRLYTNSEIAYSCADAYRLHHHWSYVLVEPLMLPSECYQAMPTALAAEMAIAQTYTDEKFTKSQIESVLFSNKKAARKPLSHDDRATVHPTRSSKRAMPTPTVHYPGENKQPTASSPLRTSRRQQLARARGVRDLPLAQLENTE